MPVPGTESVVIEQTGGAVDIGDQPSQSAIITLDALRSIDTPAGSSSTAWRSAANVADRTFYRHRAELIGHQLVENIGSDGRPRYRPIEQASDSNE